MSRFVTADNWLSQYALACGYLEYASNSSHSLKLWTESGCVGYHIRLYNDAESELVFWEVCDTLKQARANFRETCRKYQLKRTVPKG